jgi:hypothetical protein
MEIGMIDARLNIGLPAHPKTKKLIKRIGTDGAWRMVCLFLWAASNKPNGNLSGMTAEDIELAVDWPGDDGVFVSAMLDVGFLDDDDGCYHIHDWREHNPWAAGADTRSEKARWLAACKHHGRIKAAELMPEYAASLKNSASSILVADTKHPSSMQDDENSCAPSPSPSPSPSPLPNTKSSCPQPTAGDQKQSGTEADSCPHEQIIAAYHELLPMGRQVKVWNEARRSRLRSRWREDKKRQSIEWWRKFFAYIAGSDFLTGRANAINRPPFEIGLEWIVAPENFAKVIEGKFENREAA